jgi:arylsulfatase A
MSTAVLKRTPHSTSALRRRAALGLTLVLGLGIHLLATLHAAPALKPNVVLVLADDLGWTDLGCFGSDLYQTPNIDKLARDGVLFNQNYSACTVCSPTRAALMTGKYPGRLHITDWIPGLPPENPKLLVPDFTKHLPLEETTIAEVFKAGGYATASLGKWHLGGPEYYPDKQGFDLNIAGTEKPSPSTYFAPWHIPTLSEGQPGDYLTDRLGEEAVKWIEAQKDKPFFLYFPHFAVHTPIQGRPDVVAKYRAIKRAGLVHRNAVYAAMIESLDDTVGRIRTKLDELNLSDRTIIVFTSDNGGRIPTTSNRPLRAGKGSCYEGGTRVPMIVYWPGVTKPDTTNGTPVITMDLYPTLAEMAGLRVPASRPLDGVSLVPMLRGPARLAARDLFWHYPHYQHYQLGGTTPYGAIRSGNYKLIEFFDDMRVELYDLSRDVGEKHNLAAALPGKVQELRARLHAWQKEAKVQMPSRNPNYDPSRPEHTPSASKKK